MKWGTQTRIFEATGTSHAQICKMLNGKVKASQKLAELWEARLGIPVNVVLGPHEGLRRAVERWAETL